MKDDRPYLRHILSCLRRIERYTAEGRAHFLADEKTQDATLRNLQTLAESTQRLSDVRKARYPEVEWRSIAGFRNVVVHDYLASTSPRSGRSWRWTSRCSGLRSSGC